VASGPHLFTLFAGAVIAKLRRSQLIVEVRDLWPRSLVDLGSLNPDSLTAKILYWLERTSYKAAEHIVFAIPLGHKYLEELNLHKPTTVIPNGIIRDLALDKSSLTVSYRNQYPFLAVYAGLLGVANNVEQILDAAKILNHIQPQRYGFLIYGTGPQRDHLIQRVHSEKISNVHIQEPVSRREVLAIIRGSADATIFTLSPVDVFRFGISPNKISDYLAVAKPMVFSCRAGNDIAKLAECGVSADPNDPSSLALAAIALSETDPQLRRQMGERGYNYMLQHFITEDHAKLFGDVVTNSKQEERDLNAANP
jgi:glycosyltransferase involved in cell wall biosynthesis